MGITTIILSTVSFQVILTLCKHVSDNPTLSSWFDRPSEPIASGGFSFVFKAKLAFDQRTKQYKTYALKYIKTGQSQWAKPDPRRIKNMALSKIEREEGVSPVIDVKTNYKFALQMKESEFENDEFTQEIKSLETLSKKSQSHLHIVGYHGCYALGSNRIILVQDFLFETIDHRIKSEKNPFKTMRLSLVVQFIAEQILDHLAFMHKSGIAHCDFKGENLMFVRSYQQSYSQDPKTQLDLLQTRLIDFGFSSNTLCGDLLNWWGTPGFMPPESFDKRRLQKGMHIKQDIFAAGITLIDLLQRRIGNNSDMYLASKKASETSFNKIEDFETAFQTFQQQFLNNDSSSGKMIVEKRKLTTVLAQMIAINHSARLKIRTSSANIKKIAAAMREIEEKEANQQKITV